MLRPVEMDCARSEGEVDSEPAGNECRTILEDSPAAVTLPRIPHAKARIVAGIFSSLPLGGLGTSGI